MKILLIGSNGTIGSCVRKELEKDHYILPAGRSGDVLHVDIADQDSIEQLLRQIVSCDAIICCAGEAAWKNFSDLTTEDFYQGIHSKLMGQVNVVRFGLGLLPPGGSITLTTGILGDRPVDQTTSAAMVNGAIHSFVKAVNLESGERRVNAVCPGLVEDSYEKYKDYFPGHKPVPMKSVADAYRRSVEEAWRGEVIRVF